MKKIYSIKINPETDKISIFKKGKLIAQHFYSEFIYGTGMYNDAVENYPGYIVKEIHDRF